jgi:hypothetical protein
LWDAIGEVRYSDSDADHRASIAAVRQSLGEAAYAQAFERGRLTLAATVVQHILGPSEAGRAGELRLQEGELRLQEDGERPVVD